MDDMKEMYRDGIELKSIGDIYNCCETTVSDIIKKFPEYESYSEERKLVLNAKKYKSKTICQYEGCNAVIGHSQKYCARHSAIIKNTELKQLVTDKVIKHEYTRKHNKFILFNDCDYFAICSKDIISLASVEDYDFISKHGWSLGPGGYLTCRIDGRGYLLHRLLMDAESGLEVDHINLNTLDNRRENLRIVTPSQNQMNKGKMSNNTSGYKGITWDKDRNKWKVSLNENGICHNIGRFDELKDAVIARKEAEEKYFGEYAYKGDTNE